MDKEYICKKCGKKDVTLGYQIMQSKIYADKHGLHGSDVEYIICLNCGNIIESHIVNLSAFKKE